MMYLVYLLAGYFGIALIIFLYSECMMAYEHFVLKEKDHKFPYTCAVTHQMVGIVAIAWLLMLVVLVRKRT